MNVQGIAANLGEAGRWLTIPLTVLVLVLAFLAMRNAPLWAWTCSAFTASLLAVPMSSLQRSHPPAADLASLLAIHQPAHTNRGRNVRRTAALRPAIHE